MKIAGIIGFSLVALLMESKAHSAQFNGQLGFRYGTVKGSQSYENRPYLRLGLEKNSSDFAKKFRLQLRISVNHPFSERSEEFEFRPEEASFSHNIDQSRFTLGFIRVSWGESFGISILDIVNVQDESQFPLTDPEVAKLPSLSMLYEWFGEKASLQLIFTARNQYKVFEQHLKNEIDLPKPEFGARIGYLLPGNVDLNFMYFQHESRLPLYRFNSKNAEMQRVEGLMESSIGSSLSYSYHSWVFRADALYVPNFYLNDPNSLEPVARERSSYTAGIDYTTNSQLNIGVQHSGGMLVGPLAFELDDNGKGLLGYQLMQPWWQDRINTRLWYFHLPNNSGRWLKASIDINIGEKGAFSLNYDDLRGSGFAASTGTDLIEHLAAEVKWFL